MVEDLEIWTRVHHTHPVRVVHFLTFYSWKEQAGVQRPTRNDYPCQRMGLEVVQFLN